MSRPLDRIEMTAKGDVYYLGGKRVTEKKYRAVYPKPDAGTGVVGGPALSGWPMTSLSMRVHSTQVDEAMQAAVEAGVPTEYVREGRDKGRPVFRDRAHQREFCKRMGKPNLDDIH